MNSWCLEAVEQVPETDVFLVAASAVSGHLWNGRIFAVSQPGDRQSASASDSDGGSDVVTVRLLEKNARPGNVVASTETTNGNVDIKCLSKDKFVVANDAGHLQLWSYSANEKALNLAIEYNYHDDIVQSLDVRPGGASANKDFAVLSCSWDSSVKLWTISEDRDVTFTVFDAHDDMVWDVSWSKGDPNIFSSVGQDHRLLLWDQRQQGPSGVVREKAPLISVDFDPKNLFNVAVGSQAGTVSTYDTRSMKVPLTRISEQVDHARAITNIKFSKDGSQLALVSDDLHTRVFEMPCQRLVYDKQNHLDFPRGLTWSSSKPGQLVTSGWDSNITFQQVPRIPCNP